MRTTVFASVVGALVLAPLSGSAQRQPDLSGNWVLVSATTSGPLRGSDSASAAQPGTERQIQSHTISGAPFNCGRQCTIVHKGQTLTIEQALLGSNTTPAPAVTLRIDGRPMSVVDSFNPQLQIPLTAQWNGDTVEIATPDGRFAHAVSIEATQLVVVTTVNIGDAQPVTFRYSKSFTPFSAIERDPFAKRATVDGRTRSPLLRRRPLTRAREWTLFGRERASSGRRTRRTRVRLSPCKFSGRHHTA
jgi:hypothetical protein